MTTEPIKKKDCCNAATVLNIWCFANLLCDSGFNLLVGNHFLLEDVSTGLRRLNHTDDLAVGTAFTSLESGHCFLCHSL